jgi:hypothetical protein
MIYRHPEVLVITPQTRVTADDTDDTGVDISIFEGVITFVLDATNRVGTTPTLAIKLQHSNDADGTPDAWADVPGGAFTGMTDAAHSPQAITIQQSQLKKYVHTVRDIGGSASPEYDVSVFALGWRKYPA